MPQENTVKVWDPLVRVFHWSLEASFTLAHVAGVLVSSPLHGEKLAKAMWTGRKAREL